MYFLYIHYLQVFNTYIINVFYIHINICQQQKYAIAARQENFQAHRVTSTNFLSSRREIKSAPYRLGQKHDIDATWTVLKLGFPKYQLKHKLDTTPPQSTA